MPPQITLYVELCLALGLFAGAALARARQFRLHGLLQGSIVVANLGLIAFAMRPSLARYLASNHQGPERTVVLAHAAAGALAEILGLYTLR